MKRELQLLQDFGFTVFRASFIGNMGLNWAIISRFTGIRTKHETTANFVKRI
jgi:hypothetical protein